MGQIRISSKFVAVMNLLMIGKAIIPNKGLEAGRLAVITLDQDQDLGRSVELKPVDTIETVMSGQGSSNWVIVTSGKKRFSRNHRIIQ